MTGHFQHPFHCVQFLDRQSTGSQSLLIASAGPSIYSYAAKSGQRLAIWPQNADPSSKDGTEKEPPEKKRRVSDPGMPGSEEAKSAGEETGKTPASIQWSNVPLLVATSNGKYVVALTGEDKCIRVLSVSEDGVLEQLSARHMPKRPSAVVLASNDSLILCGDKSGDVYALPLIPGEHSSALPARPAAQAKPNQPAASSLTVHSGRNLKALEQQKRQWNQGEWRTEEKSGPAFEHEVILGHVSLLTDLIYVPLPSEGLSGSKRTYILTGDRDEHIRVSRGPPQAHIIENFCQGHTSFVSKLCVPEWAPEYLISGGGDSYLLVWKWIEGRIIQKVSLMEQESEVAVRGIWAVSFATGGSSEKSKAILVALDGSAQLQCYLLQPTGTLKAQNPIHLSGNALDVTSVEADGEIVVSVDCVREVGSTQEWRTNPAFPQTLLESFRVKAGPEVLEWEPVHEPTAFINSGGTSGITAPAEGKQQGKLQKELNESLYTVGNLRKKTHEDE